MGSFHPVLSRPAGPADVERFCLDRLKLACTATMLAGDASTRAYYRLDPGHGGPTLILMDTGVELHEATDPFLKARELFHRIGLPVPAVRRVFPAEGIVLLDDLGDELLQARLAGCGEVERETLYERAIAHLLVLHLEGTRALCQAPTHPAAAQALDHDRFLFELNFMIEHFALGLRQAVFTSTERSALATAFDRLAGEASAFGRVLCHRDYHSRNLMVLPDGELAVVDFQDARWGPITYDLASLLRDSYVRLSESFVDRMQEGFRLAVLARLDEQGGPAALGSAFRADSVASATGGAIEPLEEVLADSDGWRRRFDLTSLQRNLKALGTFGYQITRRDNPVYRPYIGPTSGHVRQNLLRFPEFSAVHEIFEARGVLPPKGAE